MAVSFADKMANRLRIARGGAPSARRLTISGQAAGEDGEIDFSYDSSGSDAVPTVDDSGSADNEYLYYGAIAAAVIGGVLLLRK